MQKTIYKRLINVVSQFKKAITSITIIYTITLLLKLIYFNHQIGGTRIGGLYTSATLGSLLMLASISLILKPKAAALYMNTLNVVLTLIIFSNIMFYRYFKDLISIPLLTQIGSVGDVGSSVFQLFHYSDLLLTVDFILMPFIRKVLKNKTGIEELVQGAWCKTMILCTTGLLIIVFSFSQLLKSQPVILQTFYDRVYVAQNVGLLNYHAADAFAFVQQSLEGGSELDKQKRQEIFDFFKTQKQGSVDKKMLFGAGKGKNLIVVQVEAMQQFVIGSTINGKEVTPNLNKLASSNIYFDNYYYQTAGGGTSDAEFTANVSMFPMKEGAVYIRKPGNYYYSLPIKLKEHGYSTIAMHGYKPGFWNRTLVYKNIGFDEFYSKDNMEENELLGMGISDKDFFGQAIEKLETHKQPYHAFLITLSSHFPYDNDKSKYSSFDVGKYKDTLLGNYLEAVHYTDEALGQFVEELKNKKMLDDSILVIYGDHHGIPKDNEKELAEFLEKDSLSFLEWQQLQKVPLIVRIPGVDSKKISTVGGGVDLMPTLLNIMGIDSSNQPTLGRDLVNSMDGLVVLRNGSFITNDMIYISNENRCFDIKSGNALQVEQYKNKKQQADMILDYSDTIIKYDLADEIRKYLEMKK